MQFQRLGGLTFQDLFVFFQPALEKLNRLLTDARLSVKFDVPRGTDRSAIVVFVKCDHPNANPATFLCRQRWYLTARFCKFIQTGAEVNHVIVDDFQILHGVTHG